MGTCATESIKEKEKTEQDIAKPAGQLQGVPSSECSGRSTWYSTHNEANETGRYHFNGYGSRYL